MSHSETAWFAYMSMVEGMSSELEELGRDEPAMVNRSEKNKFLGKSQCGTSFVASESRIGSVQNFAVVGL